MNIFKKLIFGLLLSGMAFTVACGDTNGDKIKEGQACESKDACDTGLKCVIDAKGKAKGLCKVECTEQNKGDKCKKNGAKACVKTMEHGASAANIMTCGADANQQQGKEVDVDGKCVAGDTCKDGSKCLIDSAAATEGVCKKACVDNPTCAAADATKPECKAEGMILGSSDKLKICVPATTQGLGEGEEGCTTDGTPATTCGTDLTCVVMTVQGVEKSLCMKECPTKGANKAECNGKEGFVNCIEGAKKKVDGTTVVNVCYAGHAAHGAACDATSGDSLLLCVKTDVCDTTVNKCLQSCSAAGADGECSSATTEDGTTSAPHCTEVAGVVACRA